ncbi:Nuclear envelope morphology protein 1 [Pseudocyphellaria aurata]|nr:Nuclear envelope morphology protein 1 [Pseudocyphellaria aurata]
MNSLNILSARVIGQTPPNSPSTITRQRSFSEGNLTKGNTDQRPRRSASQHVKGGADQIITHREAQFSGEQADKDGNINAPQGQEDEKTRLLEGVRPLPSSDPKRVEVRVIARKLVAAFAKSLELVLSTLAAPGVYLIACLYDEEGSFSPFLPIRKFSRSLPRRNGTKATTQAVGISGSPGNRDEKPTPNLDNRNLRRKSTAKLARRRPQATESFSSATSDSDLELHEKHPSGKELSGAREKSHRQSSSEGTTLARRSIRIKLFNNEDPTRRRTEKRVQGGSFTDADQLVRRSNKQPIVAVATSLKSPTSPASSSLRMTKYPRTLAPPRPLIPPRQPSYSTQPALRSSPKLGQKTLVIDLDETLIHSLAKGGRMSSGHMVEVKLNTTVGFGGTTLGPQHPILYYVHKRPHCDDFLRKVCKWYNLVVFTASVQEYADPVIDWLEQERKYFSGRYYRQHCTLRNGAYIKDLSSVEPDLTKVIILDNSPLSYIFHEDNAIPIEGWINDPTDNDLLNLIPILEGLQYVIDVRALLALRRGEAEVSH